MCRIKQMFIGLLCFDESVATKCMSLNNEPCMDRSFLVDFNPVELNCYPFTINLDKCNGSYNSVDDSFTKICFQ